MTKWMHAWSVLQVAFLAGAVACAAEVSTDELAVDDPVLQKLAQAPPEDVSLDVQSEQSGVDEACGVPYSERTIGNGCCSRNTGRWLHQICIYGQWRTWKTSCGGLCAQ